MKKYLFIIAFAYMFVVTSMNAAVYKGHRVYSKVCMKCHTSGQHFAAKRTIYQWKKLMKKKGLRLKKLHLKEAEAKKSWKYFKSSKYKKKARHLRDFLVEYAKDSGNVPACN